MLERDKNLEKTEAVKKLLSDFLKQLKIKKRIALREKKGNISGSSLFLGFGIDRIKEIKFESVDNFNSVKKLKEAELFFSKSYFLKNCKFPDYQLQIDPLLLTYVDIEIQLDNLDRKAADLLERGCRLAGEDANLLVMNLRNLNTSYFKEKKIDYNHYNTAALKLIYHAQSLSRHLAYENILDNLIVLILTLGTAFIYNKVVNGHFLFFQNTEVVKQLDTINQIVSTANPLSA